MNTPEYPIINNTNKQFKDSQAYNSIMSVSSQDKRIQLEITRDIEFITAPSTQLYEYIEPDLLRAVCKSKELLETWDEKQYAHSSCKLLSKCINEKEVLKKYKKGQLENGLIKVPYYKSKSGFGRAYVKECLGLTNFRKCVRNALIRHNYIDIDLENAQIRIACALCEMYDYRDIVHLKMYVNNRTAILNEIMDYYECDRKAAKNLMIILTFGGVFETWSKTYQINKAANDFIICFTKELKDVALFFKTHNPVLYESCRQSKLAKNKDKETKDGEVMRSFIAIYLQHWECKIISTCLQYLCNETTVLDFKGVKVATYEYDGIKVLRSGFNTFDGDLIRTLEDIVLQRIGIPVVFAFKEMEEFITVEDIKELDAIELPQDLIPIATYWDTIKKLDGDTDYALYINKNYPKRFIWCEDKKEWLCWNDTKWDRSPICLHRHISFHIPNAIEIEFNKYKEIYEASVQAKAQEGDDAEYTSDEQIFISLNKFINGSKMVRPFRQIVGENHKIKSVSECCKTWMRNEGIIFDAKDYLTGFANGVYDLEHNTFRPYFYDDFVSMSTGFDFKPIAKMNVGHFNEKGEYEEALNYIDELPADYISEEDQKGYDDVSKEIGKILPDPEVRNLVLTIFSKVYYGRPLEHCCVFNGSGGNGKGVLDELMKFIFGDYIGDADYGLITQDKSKAEGANEALMSLHRKRIVIMTEPDKQSKINNGGLKAITGGGTISARGLYEKQSKVILSNILILECNERLKFKDVPQPKGAEHRRLLDIYFGSRFTDDEEYWNEEQHIYPKNVLLKSDEWKASVRNALYNILIVKALELKAADFSLKDIVPLCVKERVEEYISSCNDLHSIFDEIYEKCDYTILNHTNIISIADIAKRVPKHSMFKDLDKSKRQEWSKASYLKNFFKTDGRYVMRYKDKVLRFDVEEFNQYTNTTETTKLKFSEYLVGYKLRNNDEMEEVEEDE